MLLCAAVGVAYGQLWGADFINLDDPTYVTENDWVRQGLTAGGVAWALTAIVSANWHPLTLLSHMLDVQLFGLNAGAHHLISVALHLVNTLLLFTVLRRMTAATGRSALVAFLFALHPLHVESVAWISERKDVLSTTFLFLALGAYEAYTRRPTLGRYAAVVIAFALGLMAKPMLVTLPFLLLLLDFWPLRRLRVGGTAVPQKPAREIRSVGWLVLEKLPLIALSVASSAVTLITQQGAMGVQNPLSVRVPNALIAYVRYVRKMLWPVDLAVFYPYDPTIAPWTALGASLLLLAISTVAVRAYRTRPALTVGWLWYLGGLVPVIGIVQVGRHALADRYTYVPLVGLFIAIVWSAADALTPLRAGTRYAIVGAVATVCLVATTLQVSYWRNSATVFAHALAVTRGNYMAYLQVGAQLDADGNPAEAARYYTEALRAKPDFAEAHNNLALVLAKTGDHDAALRHYDAALRADPTFADAHYNRGLLLQQTGHPVEAAEEYRQALALKPSYPDAHSNLGMLLVIEGRDHEAEEHYRRAIVLKPSHVEAHSNLGNLLVRRGRLQEGVAQLVSAVRLEPDRAELHNNLGIALAAQGKHEEAMAEYAEAIRLAPQLAEAHHNMGNSLVEVGRFAEAATQYREALRINPALRAAQQNLDTLPRMSGLP